MQTSTRPSLRIVAATVAVVAIGLAGTAAARPASSAVGGGSHASASPPDWLANVTAEHRQLFDAPAPAGGLPLVHIMNYYDTYNRAFQVNDADIDAVGTFYGSTTFHALNDAMWAKYRLGEIVDVKDPATGAAPTANPWRANPHILGMDMPGASIEALQKRGTTFILCDNALGFFAGVVAEKHSMPRDSVYADLRANMLPGVILVPGMVVAIEQAHRAGLSYHRQ